MPAPTLHLRAVFACFIYALNTQAELCATPKSLEGNCTDVRDCPEIGQLLQGRNLNVTDAIFVRQSQCGFEDDAPKVCCAVSNATEPFREPARPAGKKISIGVSSRALIDDELPTRDECGQQIYEEENRIYDGVITGLGEFPWAVLLKYRTDIGDGYACGGTLISKRYVLTAAHCVSGRIIELFGPLIAVTLGEHDINKQIDCDLGWGDEHCAPPSIEIHVENHTVHPLYIPNSPHRYHDIALIRLENPVTFSDYIQPICLPSNDGPQKRSKFLYVAGWGETKNGAASNIKLKARLPEIPLENCSKIYEQKRVKLKEGQMCAGGRRQDSCRGDSGGPLMLKDTSDPELYRWHVMGVVSFGVKKCATIGIPAVYTKTSAYIDWIKDNVKV